MEERIQTLEIGLTPSGKGRFYRENAVVTETNEMSSGIRSIFFALEKSLAEGLAELYRQNRAASDDPFFRNPEVRFWTGFCELFLRELCQTPEESFATIEAAPLFERLVPSEKRRQMVESAPFMIGAEFLRPELLAEVGTAWTETALRYTRSGQDGFDRFLQERAPGWHGVGSVWFHLAENKRDDQRPFCFLATFTTSLSAAGRIQHQPLGRALVEYAGAKNQSALQKILAPIRQAEQNSPLLREIVKTGEIYAPGVWTEERAYEFLRSASVFEESGIKIHLPDWWKRRVRPKVQVTVGEKMSRVGLDALLDFKVSIALGDEKLTAAEIKKLLAADGGLVSLRGEWVEADGAKLKEALAHWESIRAEHAQGVDFLEGMRLLAGAPRDFSTPEKTLDKEWTTIKQGKFLEEKIRDVRALSDSDLRTELASLRATLRPYQRDGLGWLRFGVSLGLGLCLADDMGLGKTVQLIALLLWIQNRQKKGPKCPSLLVLPASLLANWKSELTRFAPTLSVHFVHPSMNGAAGNISENHSAKMSSEKIPTGGDLVVTTYGMILRRPDFVKRTWNLIVLDEAQAIKNSGTRQTKQVKKLKGAARIALTGTPVENRLNDLWSIFDFLNPGYLGGERAFLKWSKCLSGGNEEGYQPLRKLVSPLILRRLKTDRAVIADLPDKTEMTVFAPLVKEQVALYAGLVEEMKDAIRFADGIKRRGIVLSYLMKFKQVCNHPSHYRGIPEYDPLKSGKFSRLAELCEEIASRQEKTLVFTQFREMTGPLDDFLASVFHRRGLVLHGGTAVGKRKALVDAFQSDDGPAYFVLSLKAGGTGLNLTAASHVIHFDRWWNPAVEDQATDRAFRIGQTKNVLVHKFVCRGTIEERIDAMITEKKSLAGEILSQGAEKTLTEMSNDEIMKFVAFDGTGFAEE